VEKKPDVLCPFFWTFSYHCIPGVTEHFDVHFIVYSMPIWNKFIVEKTLNIEDLQLNLAFVIVQE
jgi:hypothetical protein